MKSYDGVHLSRKRVKGREYWFAWWYADRGRRCGKSVGRTDAMSEHKAKQAAKRIERSMATSPTLRAPRGLTLRAWWERFGVIARVSDTTMAEYATTFDLLAEKLCADSPLNAIGPLEAMQFEAWLCDRKGRGSARLSEATVRKHLRQAKMIFGKAVAAGLMIENPFRSSRTAAVALDDDWPIVPYATVKHAADAALPCWRLAFSLARLAGLRASEIARLQWRDVAERSIVVIPPTRRVTTKHRRRTVPIEPRLRAILEACRQPEGRVCEGLPTDPATISRGARRLIVAAGIEPWPKPLHTLRKSLETEWLAAYPIMDVAKWLGHSPTVAMKHYHQPTAADDVTSGSPAHREMQETLADLTTDQLVSLTEAARAIKRGDSMWKKIVDDRHDLTQSQLTP